MQTVLGAELAEADRETLEKLNIENGLIVTDLLDGKLKNAGIKKGFIITHVNKRKVNSIDDIKNVIKMSRGGVLIEGIYPNGEEAYYVFGLD